MTAVKAVSDAARAAHALHYGVKILGVDRIFKRKDKTVLFGALRDALVAAKRRFVYRRGSALAPRDVRDAGLYAERGNIFYLTAVAVGYRIALVALVPDQRGLCARQVHIFDRDAEPPAEGDGGGKVAVGIRRHTEADKIKACGLHDAKSFLI